MPPAGKGNTRARQVRRAQPMVPHGPGGQMLRRAAPRAPAPRRIPRPIPLARPAPRPYRPTARQVRNARAQRDAYKSQGGAVRRAAKTQERLGPGFAARPKKGSHVLHTADVMRYARTPAVQGALRAREYASQGRAVEKVANQQRHDSKPENLIFSKDPAKLARAGFKSSKTADTIGAMPLRALINAPKDAYEVAVTTPTSLAKLAVGQAEAVGKSVAHGSPKPLLKFEGDTAKGLIKPYVDAVKDPVKAISEHPVGTALMFAPTAKVPRLAIGRGLRVAGKQTLAREPATIAGTTIKEARTGSRNADWRARQERQDKHQGVAPVSQHRVMGGTKKIRGKEYTLGASPLERRADEFYDWGQQHKQAALHSASKVSAKRHKGLPKDQRQAAIEHDLSGASGGAHQHVEREFAREFGSHWQVHHPEPKKGKPAPKPIVVKPKNMPEGSGHIHATHEDARLVADAIKAKGHFDPHIMQLEGATPGETSGFAVVPKQVHGRYAMHKRVGHAGFTFGPTLRASSQAFRRTVLPTSAKWLTGQAVEAAVRNAAMGAGPTSLLRYRRLMRELEKVDPKAAKALKLRAVQGGQFGTTGAFSDFTRRGQTLAETFKGSSIEGPARMATDVGALPVLKQARGGYHHLTKFVFNEVNGRIEKLAKEAMLGKALKQGPLMERSIVDLTGKATREAAQGLRATSNQVELARAVDRAYGRYSKYGPHARDMILHTTPFIPWFRNMVQFLTHVMPKDHPVKTSLIVAANQADEDWRKAHRLSTRGKSKVPGFMMGSIPSGPHGTKYRQVGRFGPFLPGEAASALGGQVYPQIAGAGLNLAGVDWTGNKIRGKHYGEDASNTDLVKNAALTEAEALIPLVGQADRITGLGDRYVRGKTKKASVGHGKTISQGVLDTFNPVREIGVNDKKSKSKKGRKRSGALKSGGGGSGILKSGSGSGILK